MPQRFVFDCPACETEMVVDADVRSDVLADGCVLCRAPVDAGDFAPVADDAVNDSAP
jgi:Zn-finger nucleic acid-binding protein